MLGATVGGQTLYHPAQAGGPNRLFPVVHDEKHPFSSENSSECHSGGRRWQSWGHGCAVRSQDVPGDTDDLRVKHIRILGQCVVTVKATDLKPGDVIVGVDGCWGEEAVGFRAEGYAPA